MEVVEDNLWDSDPETIWTSIQLILTKNKMSRYFNRIGFILVEMGLPGMIEVSLVVG